VARSCTDVRSPSPPSGRTSPPSGEESDCLALGVLGGFAGSLQAVLLALLHARVARQEAGLLEHRAALDVELDERPGDAVRDRARLARHAPARDPDADVEAPQRVGELERLQDLHLQDSLTQVSD